MVRVIAILGVSAVALFLTLVVGLARGWPHEEGWWDSEGVPIFLVIWLILGALWFGAM